jgi:hypothetical protein
VEKGRKWKRGGTEVMPSAFQMKSVEGTHLFVQLADNVSPSAKEWVK